MDDTQQPVIDENMLMEGNVENGKHIHQVRGHWPTEARARGSSSNDDTDNGIA
jgi:hypothetical protein